MFKTLDDLGLKNTEAVSKKVKKAFLDYPNWKKSEKELRELRKLVTFAIFSEEDDLDKVTNIVDNLFTPLS